MATVGGGAPCDLFASEEHYVLLVLCFLQFMLLVTILYCYGQTAMVSVDYKWSLSRVQPGTEEYEKVKSEVSVCIMLDGYGLADQLMTRVA